MFLAPTIDSILNDFNKKVAKLRSLAGEHHNNHLLQTENAIRAQETAAAELANRDRANRIADKIAELLN
jgi:hypothetical protein